MDELKRKKRLGTEIGEGVELTYFGDKEAMVFRGTADGRSWTLRWWERGWEFEIPNDEPQHGYYELGGVWDIRPEAGTAQLVIDVREIVLSCVEKFRKRSIE